MTSLISFRAISILVAGGLLSMGCSASAGAEPDATQASTEALAAAKIAIPAGDPCREALVPLAIGLADGVYGVQETQAITVSLKS